MFRNILVSVDGSCHAQRALSEAIDLAELSHGRLTLVTAIRTPASFGISPFAASACQACAVELERDAKRVLRAAADRVPADIPVTTILTREPIRTVLRRQIDSGRHDILVMGARGRTALRLPHLRSTVRGILRRPLIPVLVVHADGDPVPAPLPGPSRSLVPEPGQRGEALRADVPA